MAMTTVPESGATTATETDANTNTAPVSFARMLVALDASEHANRALDEAIRLAGSAHGTVTGIHAYAAKLHDVRFRQMEGGLPERYLEEEEMDYQRDVHDDLISRGLRIITDSYHDYGERVCEAAGVPYRRLSPEGKNYRRVVEALESGEFDVIALGALGIGAVPGAAIGTVCERVVRRSPIDVLVVRDPARMIGDGPIVVAVDGSSRSYGALMTGLEIGRWLGIAVHAVAAYDPYYHYVAFNKIAGVLSEEAGKVFRFQEQQQLHEELIDDGIAKIYQSHLDVVRRIAADHGAEVQCELVDGKIYKAIAKYAERVGASLLMMGKVGIHGDDALDIGGNAENLLRTAPCNVWLAQAAYTPPFEVVAEETISWSNEAEAMLDRAPEFVRGMARKAVLRLAQERGHTYITSDLVQEVADQMMPGRGAAKAIEDKPLPWSADAEALIAGVEDGASVAAGYLRLRAEKRARREGADRVLAVHVSPFLDRVASDGEGELAWEAAALARLSRVPESMRAPTRVRIEGVARQRGAAAVTLEIVEAGLAEARSTMEAAIEGGAGRPQASGPEEGARAEAPVEWTAAAEERMRRVPEGAMRDMTRMRIEAFARRSGVAAVTPELIEDKYEEWAGGSGRQASTMAWTETARSRIDRIPEFIRAMVMDEIERCAREMAADTVTDEVVDRARESWEKAGAFHSDSDPDLYK